MKAEEPKKKETVIEFVLPEIKFEIDKPTLGEIKKEDSLNEKKE